MPAYKFLKNEFTKKWNILAPKRAHRPDAASGRDPACPFCEPKSDDGEIVRILDEKGELLLRVVPNKFPFADPHELIIDTPNHHISLESFSQEHLVKLFTLYKERYNEHSHKGQVFIFHNRGLKAGESIPHSHTQIAVFPEKVNLETPYLKSVESDIPSGFKVDDFTVVCPKTSVWPDEVWIVPSVRGKTYGEITFSQTDKIAQIFSTLIRMYTLRYDGNFPYNFYIFSGSDWYVRMIPRNKTLGGVEVGTGVFVNTQDPLNTLDFIRTHYYSLDEAKIKSEHPVDYATKV